MVGQLSDYISDQLVLPKFENTGNPILTISINNVSIGNSLIDLGAAINVMSISTLQALQLNNMSRPTPTILELLDKITIKHVGALDEIIITVLS